MKARRWVRFLLLIGLVLASGPGVARAFAESDRIHPQPLDKITDCACHQGEHLSSWLRLPLPGCKMA